MSKRIAFGNKENTISRKSDEQQSKQLEKADLWSPHCGISQGGALQPATFKTLVSSLFPMVFLTENNYHSRIIDSLQVCKITLYYFMCRNFKYYLLTGVPTEDSNHLVVWLESSLSPWRICILCYPKCAQWRFWSDYANASAELNLCLAHVGIQ